MNIPQILDALSYERGFPEAAIVAARQHREELVPLFLREIEEFLAVGSQAYPSPDLLFIGFHLLGEWQETRAYRPLARLLRGNPDDVQDLLSDAITETAHRVLVRVFDGDLEPLRSIILDAAADEYVRWMMFETISILAAQGRVSRATVESFLRECFDLLRPRGESPVWAGWNDAIAYAGLTGLLPLTKQAFDNGWIDPDLTNFDATQKLLELTPEAMRADGWILDQYEPFVDTVAELSKWEGSQAGFGVDLREGELDDSAMGSVLAPQPYVKRQSTPGRNDPCPCGSGKKYKKCCLSGSPSRGAIVRLPT